MLLDWQLPLIPEQVTACKCSMHGQMQALHHSDMTSERARTYTHRLGGSFLYIYNIWLVIKKYYFPHLTRDRGADCYDTHRLLHYTRDVHMQHSDSTDASLSFFKKSFKIESLRDNWVKGRRGKEGEEGGKKRLK